MIESAKKRKCFNVIKGEMTETIFVSLAMCLVVLMCNVSTVEFFFFDKFVLPKWTTSLFLMGLVACFHSVYNIGRRHSAYNSRFDFIIILFSFILLSCSVFRCKNYFFAVRIIFFFVSFMTFKSLENLSSFKKMMSITLSVCCLYSLVELLLQHLSKEPLTGPFDTTVGLSLLFSLTVVFMLYTFCLSTHGFINKLATGFIIFLCFILFVIGSRTAILSLIFSFMFYPHLKKQKKYIIICCVSALVILFAIRSKSTHGRMFIYKTSISLLDTPEHIFFGRGYNGFRHDYMVSQAELLEKESDETRFLADNITHPLNEFIMLTIDFGLICVAMTMLAIFYAIIKSSKANVFQRTIIIVILIYSLFTYPFTYPMTWISLSFALANLEYDGERCKSSKMFSVTKYVMFISGIVLSASSISLSKWNNSWKKAYSRCMLFNDSQSLEKYGQLAKSIHATPEFFYNYSYIMLNSGNASKADEIISGCGIIDYDTELLRGDIKAALGSDSSAVECYDICLRMCPNRFVPLYAKYKLYRNKNDKESALEIRNIILSKQVKVPSEKIDEIRDNVRDIRWIYDE